MDEYTNTAIERTTEEELKFWQDQYFERREAAIQSQDRERVLREALEFCVSFIDELKDHGIDGWSREKQVKEALEASK